MMIQGPFAFIHLSTASPKEQKHSDKEGHVSEICKKISTARNHENPKLKELVEKFSERKNASDSKIIEEIFVKSITENTLPIPFSNPFIFTDLMVFKESYKGAFPLNGINFKESKNSKDIPFDDLTSFYEDIRLGNTKFQIEGNEAFKEIVWRDIKKLLTRKLGRMLIKRLINKQKVETIKIIESERSRCTFGFESVTIYFYPSNNLWGISKNSKGKKILIHLPSFLIFAHEMIHALYDHKNPHKKKELTKEMNNSNLIDLNFDNLDEQENIIGIRQPIDWQNDQSVLDLDEDELEKLLLSTPIFKYNKISENTLRSAFRMPYRADHKGIEKPTHLTISGTEIDPKLNDYFQFLVSNELLDELDEFAKINQHIDLTKITIKGRNFLETSLETTLKSDNLTVFKKLLDLGANPNFYLETSNEEEFSLFEDENVSKMKWHFVQYAAHSHAERILCYLLSVEMRPKIHFEINHQDEMGNTLLHNLLHHSYIAPAANTVQLLLNLGLDLKLKNIQGETVLFKTAKQGFSDLFFLLLQAGADVYVTDFNKTNIVQISSELFDLTILIYLLKQQNISDLFLIKNGFNQTILHLIAHNQYFNQTPKINIETKIQLICDLISKGIDPNAKDSYGNTFWHYLNKNMAASLQKMLSQ